jgi:hypothetical protein
MMSQSELNVFLLGMLKTAGINMSLQRSHAKMRELRFDPKDLIKADVKKIDLAHHFQKLKSKDSTPKSPMPKKYT